MSRLRIWRAVGPLAATVRSGAEARTLLQGGAVSPTVELHPRVDGPGSSLDLPRFAAAAQRFPAALDLDAPDWGWSRGALRTPGICLDVAPLRFRAVPADDPRAFEHFAPGFHDRPLSAREPLPAEPRSFVLNVLRQFGLVGVRVESEPTPAAYRGAGLGGSNLAHAAALTLAAGLAGLRLSLGQLYVWASQLENSYGVSLTGGQETLTALQGGVWDNVHLPGQLGPFGVLSRELVPRARYEELGRHLLLVNTGVQRAAGATSADVNGRWMAAWRTVEGAALHLEKPELAWRAAEALREGDWPAYVAAVRRYREIRVELCPAYVDGQDELMVAAAELGLEPFPLGAGGGTCLVAGVEPGAVAELRRRIDATADPSIGRLALPVVPRSEGMRCLGFAELGLPVPAGPETPSL